MDPKTDTVAFSWALAYALWSFQTRNDTYLRILAPSQYVSDHKIHTQKACTVEYPGDVD